AAATGYDLLKQYDQISSSTWPMLLTGGLVAFGVALLAVKAFIVGIDRFGFKAFGYYRILVGLLFLVAYVWGGWTLD
ncbi:MAG: undecaprenyl-diphosphate phosphatase, partial [Bacteroidia bacterium]